MVEVPALDHDALMLSKYGVKVSPNGRLERRIVANLIAHLAAAGFAVVGVYDGEEESPAADAKAAMELIFNLDESYVRFTKDGAMRGVYLVLGNGIDIVSDYSYAEGDADGFDAAMQAFDAEAFA